jgi:TRAP-type mannitol/chloroaromatic compound transport system substrate-binding protein
MKRREFIKVGTISAIGLVSSACSNKEEKYKSVNIDKNKKTKIKLATSWPAKFPIMGEGVEIFAKNVKQMSGDTLDIKVYPKNTLVPALEVFDAASAGNIDAFHSGPYYWKGKNSAFSLFGGYPFGQTENELSSWFEFGGGLELWREMYKKHNLYPMLGGNTSVQMGGWFKKEINTLDDLKGLKMRIPGLGGEVLSKMGVSPVLLPAGEIFIALERGVLDATEWVGPALDTMMGFYKVAPYYYNGWHEPGSTLELTFNLNTYNKLSKEHKAIIQSASAQMHSRMIYEFQAKNAKA